VAGIVQVSPSAVFFMVPRRILPERVLGSRAPSRPAASSQRQLLLSPSLIAAT
jgi:hypothetical protein